MSAAAAASAAALLFLPLAADHRGLNDQLAVGTPRAMAAYASWGEVVATAEAPLPGRTEQAVAMAVDAGGLRPRHLRRFWYEYALVREGQAGWLESEGVANFTMHNHAAYAWRYILSDAPRASVVDLGTVCTFDPERDIPRGRLAQITKQHPWAATHAPGGWTLAELRCAYQPRPPCPRCARYAALAKQHETNAKHALRAGESEHRQSRQALDGVPPPVAHHHLHGGGGHEATAAHRLQHPSQVAHHAALLHPSSHAKQLHASLGGAKIRGVRDHSGHVG